MDQEKQLSEERLAELKDELSKLLAMDRYMVVSRYPFIGGILMHLILIPTRDCRNPTACTDGKHVYFDIAFYSGLSEAERLFVLAHETWHCVLLHTLRCNGRNPMIWNIAIDMETNNIIDSSCGDYVFKPPKGVLFPPQHLKDHSAEEIYEYLMKNAKQEQLQNMSGSSSKDSKKSKGNGGRNNNRSQSGGSGGGGKIQGQFDTHSNSKGNDGNEGQDNENGEGEGEAHDKYGKVGYDEDFKPSAQRQYADDIRDAVIAEAQKVERQQGDLPANIKKLIEKYRKPEIRWQDELAKFVTPIFGGRRQWLPPNRRHVYDEIYLQTRRSESIDVVVAIDTSGSCLYDLPKFFTELCGLVESFGHYKLMIIQCDCRVTRVDEYESEGNRFDPDTKFQSEGGGGTSFCPPFDYLKQHGITPSCFIYFTDGYGDAPEKKPNYPVMWILTSDCDQNFCDWGKKIVFKQKRDQYGSF